MAEFICKVCDLPFKSYNKNAKYCSQACKGQAYIKYPIKNCEICEKEYKPRVATSKYCSLKCSVIGKNKAAIGNSRYCE
ncbi:hypothetical protein FZC66_06185 [Priestia megaterium]|nr:hypothetical protein FZC66_06185 [Priestia megaterium]